MNIAVMVGGFPYKEGMERRDVMSKNVSIYKAQASALEEHAARDVKVGCIYLWSMIFYLVLLLVLAEIQALYHVLT